MQSSLLEFWQVAGHCLELQVQLLSPMAGRPFVHLARELLVIDRAQTVAELGAASEGTPLGFPYEGARDAPAGSHPVELVVRLGEVAHRLHDGGAVDGEYEQVRGRERWEVELQVLRLEDHVIAPHTALADHSTRPEHRATLHDVHVARRAELGRREDHVGQLGRDLDQHAVMRREHP